MALQYEGKNIGTIRDAVEGDEDYAPGKAVVLLPDGTLKTVDRSEVKTEAQQEAEKKELEELEAATAPETPPVEEPPVIPPAETPPPETPAETPPA